MHREMLPSTELFSSDKLLSQTKNIFLRAQDLFYHRLFHFDLFSVGRPGRKKDLSKFWVSASVFGYCMHMPEGAPPPWHQAAQYQAGEVKELGNNPAFTICRVACFKPVLNLQSINSRGLISQPLASLNLTLLL
jgi:hypothetical protein